MPNGQQEVGGHDARSAIGRSGCIGRTFEWSLDNRSGEISQSITSDHWVFDRLGVKRNHAKTCVLPNTSHVGEG
jgi:hypothetical protein